MKQFMIFTAQRKLKGFTLIELLIVIAILGILAAAVLIAINPAKRQNQAKDSNIKSDIGSVATALQAFYTEPGAGQYPCLAASAGCTQTGVDTLVTNKDLVAIPTPPAGGTGGGSYQTNYRAYPAACNNLAAGTPCVDAAIYYLMFENTGTQVWCWESKTGKAQIISVAANCDDSAATL